MVDLVDVITDLGSFRWDFLLVPKQWTDYDGPASLRWKTFKLAKANRRRIPQTSGIYVLRLYPGISSRESSYLMYIGLSRNLHERFYQYLTSEQKRRPRIVRLLNLYSDHIWFSWSKVPESRLEAVEDSLLRAFLPPCNDEIDGIIGTARRAF